MVTSHLGRPTEGEFKPEDSLAPVAERLGELLGREVPLVRDWVDGVDVQPGEVVLLENCRVNKGEKKNDPELARRWPRCATSSCTTPSAPPTAPKPRPTASPSSPRSPAPARCWRPRSTRSRKALAQPQAAAGGHRRRLQGVDQAHHPASRWPRNVDQLIVGGGIANTFMLAAGLKIGKSLAEADLVGEAKAVIEAMKARGAAVPIPDRRGHGQDLRRRRAGHREGRHRRRRRRPDPGHRPADRAQLAEQLKSAGTIVWNGPVGVFEFDAFANGTETIARAIAESSAFSIAGGGDTLAAIAKYGIEKDVGYISTGGGAFLEVLEGKTLPAFEILQKRAKRVNAPPAACARRHAFVPDM